MWIRIDPKEYEGVQQALASFGFEGIVRRLNNEHRSMRSRADRALRELATRVYADPSDDNLEIDEDAAFSVAPHGTWVQAWVWMPKEVEDVD